MNVKNHILYDEDGRVPYKQSPNHGGVITPTYGIIHYDASPNETGAISWMISPQSKVSAHLHITRSGKVTQLLALNVRGYHAGESSWKGINGMNSHSIGIELQNTGTQEYTDIQIRVLVEVVKALNETYPIKEWIGHNDVSPGRKIDPGQQFPWMWFREETGEKIKDMRHTTSDLNMRVGAGTQYSKITVLPKGTEVQVLSTDKGWSLIFVPNSKQTGYVSNQYLTK